MWGRVSILGDSPPLSGQIQGRSQQESPHPELTVHLIFTCNWISFLTSAKTLDLHTAWTPGRVLTVFVSQLSPLGTGIHPTGVIAN